MIVFMNYMKRILKSKAQLVVILLLPLIPIVPIALRAPVSEQSIIVGIADEDQTKLTAAFKEAMKANCKVLEVTKDKIENELLNSTIHYAIVIEKGYTERMIKSGDSVLAGYTKPEMDFTPLIRSYADSFTIPVKSIAAASDGSSEKFYSGLKYFTEGTVSVGSELVSMPDTSKATAAWGMMLQFMMFSSIFSATLLITDKENRTFFRTLSASIRLRSYMFQSILSFLTISILQIFVLLAVTVAVLGVYPGVSVLNMFLLLVVFSLVSISMGIAISSFSRNSIQASIFGAGIVVLMCVAGGAWGAQPSSGIVRNLSKMDPITWAMESVDQLVNKGDLSSITGHLGILLLFAIVFFMLGTWRKADIAK